MNKILRKLDKLARRFFAPYLVQDYFGTEQLCWSWEEANEWLPYCATGPTITDRRTMQYVWQWLQ